METLLSMLMPSLIPWLGLVCVVINSSSVLFWRWGGWTFPVLLYNEVMAYDQKYVSLFYYGIICCQIYQSLCDISYSIIRFTGSWEQISNNKVFSVILTKLHCVTVLVCCDSDFLISWIYVDFHQIYQIYFCTCIDIQL